jgi:hypothetical protein
MLKIYVTFWAVCLLLLSLSASAQSFMPSSARAAGMANTALTLSDEWANHHNIAGIAQVRRYAVGLWYKDNYGIKAYRETSASLSVPLPIAKGGGAAMFYRFGNDVYHFSRFSLGYAHYLHPVSIGVQVHYLHTAMAGHGANRAVVLEAGLQAALVPDRLRIGIVLFNLSQTRSAAMLIPLVMRAGLSYHPGKKTLFNVEAEKNLLYQPSLKIGMEYRPVGNFFIRTGLSSRPMRHYAGLGLANARCQIDYAVSHHSQLGFSHQLGFLLFFSKTKK